MLLNVNLNYMPASPGLQIPGKPAAISPTFDVEALRLMNRMFRIATLCATMFVALSNYCRAVVVPFSESFTSNAANWTGPATGQALAHNALGGVDNGGYVSHATANIPVAGSFMNPTQGGIAFRATLSDNPSGSAFSGNWLAANVNKVQAYVQHDYTVAPVEFFVRVTNGPAMVFFADSTVSAGDQWTKLSFAITPDNGTPAGGTFLGTLANVQNLQIGARLPGNLDQQNTPIAFKLDQVSVVPEPATVLLTLGAIAGGLPRRWRRVG